MFTFITASLLTTISLMPQPLSKSDDTVSLLGSVVQFNESGKIEVWVGDQTPILVFSITDSVSGKESTITLPASEAQYIADSILLAIMRSAWSPGDSRWIHVAPSPCTDGCLMFVVDDNRTEVVMMASADDKSGVSASIKRGRMGALLELAELVSRGVSQETALNPASPSKLNKAQKRAAEKSAQAREGRLQAIDHEMRFAHCRALKQIPMGKITAQQLHDLAACQ